MSFNNWPLSSTINRQPLSTTTTNLNDKSQQAYYYQYHYHYPSMTINVAQSFDYYHYQPTMTMIDHQVPLNSKETIQRNSILKLHRCVALFLHLIDNSSISDFLQHDKHFRHADKYLLAMTLIYFWRAKLREHHFTKASFYLALWLAHDSVEEDLTAKYGLLPWALQTADDRPSVDLKNDFKRFLTKKNDLWTRMGFRARVTKDDCEQIMLVQPNHWIWQRERSFDYNQQMSILNRRQKNGTLNIEHSSSSTISMSPIDNTKSMIIFNADNFSWTSDDDDDKIDEIILLN